MTEERIRKYFLGEMSEAEAETLEDALIEDKNLFSQAEIIENEIIDDYLKKRLSAYESLSFAENYPITEARQEKIRSAEGLFQILRETRPETVAADPQDSFRNSLLGNYSFFRTLTFAAGAIVVFAAVAAGILFYRQNNQETVRRENVNHSPAAGNENKNAIDALNSSVKLANVSNTEPEKSPGQINKTPKAVPSPETKSSPVKIDERAKPIFASFTLLPGSLRSGSEQIVKISPGIDKLILRLVLPLNAEKYPAYRATVKSVDGQVVFASTNLISLNLLIPAAKLRRETYIVFLEGIPASKPAESVTEYIFRAAR